MASGGATKPEAGKRAARGPVSAQTRRRIVKLAQAVPPMSRNAIARETGVSAGTVTRVVREKLPEHSWGREGVAAATQAKVIDMKATRVRHAEGLLGDLDKLRGMFWEPATHVHYSVANGRKEYEAPRSTQELKDMAITYGILLDKHMALVRFDGDDRDLPAVEQWLRGMGVGGQQTVVAA